MRQLLLCVLGLSTICGFGQGIRQRVPATVDLTRPVNYRGVPAGNDVQMKLLDTVTLNSGVVLSKGSVLTAEMLFSDMANNGPHTLTLKFTTATLKDGSTLPIVATVVDFATIPSFVGGSDVIALASPSIPDEKYGRTVLRPMQEDMTLLSDSEEANSGTFVNKRHKISFPLHSKFCLFLAATP